MITLHGRDMIRFFYFFIFFVPAITTAQVDSVVNKTSPFGALVSSRVDTLYAKVEKTYSITITVTHIRNSKGVLRFKFYDDTTPFPDDHGFLKVVVPKSEIVGSSFTRTYYGFISRNMAIAVLDDENNDVKLDMGWFLPKEGYAFSDYYHSALRRPVYKDFSFVLMGDKNVTMRMKYY